MPVEIREILIRGTVREDGSMPGTAPLRTPAEPSELSQTELITLIRRQVEIALRNRAER